MKQVHRRLAVGIFLVFALIYFLRLDSFDSFDLEVAPQPKDQHTDLAILQNATREVISALVGQAQVTLLMWWPADWAGLRFPQEYRTPNYLGTNLVRDKCNMPCTFTEDRTRIREADGLILEVSVNGANDWPYRNPPLMPPKFSEQPWIMLSYEQPDYFRIQSDRVFVRNIDLNATYDQSSQIPVTFTCPWAGFDLEAYRAPPVNPDERKGVVFIQTNCKNGGATFRTAYVLELMKYIQVDSYGHCLNNMKYPDWWGKEQSHGGLMAEKIKLFSQYKFVLAFENNNVTDYVTEKLPHAFLSGALPIYMGAPNIDDWLPGEMSIVKTDTFSGPEALARFIKFLDSDKKAYQDYFYWRHQPFSEKFLEKYSRCLFTDSLCRMCNKVWETNIKSSLAQISKTVDLKSHEGLPQLTLNYLKQIKENRAAPGFLYLDGNSEIRVPSNPALTLSDKFTIALWINLEEFTIGSRLVDSNEAGSLDGYNLDLFLPSYDGTVPVTHLFVRFCGSINCYVGSRPIRLKTWTHVAFTFDVTGQDPKIAFYVNGKLDRAEPIQYPVAHSRSFDLVIGGPASGEAPKFKGDVDDIKIWKRALSEEEISKIAFGSAVDERALVLHFPLDEQQGILVTDIGPFHHTGIINGNTKWWDGAGGKPLILSPTF